MSKVANYGLIILTTPPKFNIANTKEANPVVNQPTKVVANKTKGVKKGTMEHDMGYDIVEDIRKAKENISLFELCNFTQKIKKLLEAFDPQPSSSQ